MTLRFSENQIAAMRTLASDARLICLFGGARSGKTVLIVRAIIIRALKAPGSRHLIARLRSNAAWTSIAGDANATLFTVAVRGFEGLTLAPHRQDGYFALPNGSTIWIGGLDDKERVDKILGREYCVCVDSKVLTAELKWIRAADISVGQELIAFPEELYWHIKMARSVVERADVIETPRYLVVTDKGETIVSHGHSFVALYDDRRTRNFRRISWRKITELRVGDKIKFACPPWKHDPSWDSGWMAGMLDGEGWATLKSGTAGIAQNPGVILDHIRRLLDRNLIKYRFHISAGNNCIQLLAKGFWQALRMIGIFRPIRLLEQSGALWEGRRGFTKIGDSAHLATILKIEDIGIGKVVAFRTSTRTLIADGFLGHNSSIYLNEASEIPYATVLTALTRLAEVRTEIRQRAFIDLNPVGKSHWTNRLFNEYRDPVSLQPIADRGQFASVRLNPADNVHNLTPEFMAYLEGLPEKQRKRFLEGEYVDEVEGALWSYEVIEKWRRVLPDIPEAKRESVVVAVDPSGAKNRDDFGADEIGIIVAARGRDGHGYVLADRSLRASPAEWGRAAVNAYHEFRADCIVAEGNFGGEMVRSTIQGADRNVPVRMVTASRGKTVRAEPVSARYEQGHVHHVGRFPVLEDQLCAFSTAGYVGENSPDHADAAIWALSHLMCGPDTTGMIEFYRREVEAAKTPERIGAMPVSCGG